jgi:hypothetical protein
MKNKILNRLKDAWQSLLSIREDSEKKGTDREKAVVFTISVFLAFCIWLIVNLNRDYNLDVDVSVELGNITSEKALAEELPSTVTASVTGDGWNLINMYNNPPRIYLDVSDNEINLFEQVRRYMGAVSNVRVQTVEPLYLQVRLEDKASKTVPLVTNVKVGFAEQYDFLEPPALDPDSITIRGASSRLARISRWPTDSLVFNNVKDSFSTELELRKPESLITLSQSKVNYSVEVAEYTEDEVTVPIETRDFPVGDVISFSPSSVKIKYRIPLREYAAFNKSRPFRAYVLNEQIQQDTTGFISPQIEKLPEKAHMKVRTVQPSEVAYFMIIDN